MRADRHGFSLVELLVALVLTAIIGASLTTLFVTQSRFLEQQQKQEFARGVARSATNIMMSELRMVDRDSGITAASPTSITARVPFAMGVVCGTTGLGLIVTFQMFPVDPSLYNVGNIDGFAYRGASGYYQYRVSSGSAQPATSTAGLCATNGISAPAGSQIMAISTVNPAAAVRGDPIMLFRNVRYHFAASAAVPGRVGLYREVEGVDEEIVAPFDNSAGFAFFVNDALTSQSAAPASSALNTLTGLEIKLNSISERPNADGTYTVVPMTTGVFFKNRRN
ncbi:MAG TPA: prepilin-type N-terminal cleavage/methylation domain-containing protein [Longimicrobiales bacterium]